jgi:uncharacterized protein (TIGR02145 family)
VSSSSVALSSAIQSSSSAAASACNQTGTVYGDPVSYEGETYQTVVICGQTWMARNLNYIPPATGNSWCYNDDASNCEKYGRLYDWATAKAVCPSNWHLPTKGDWDTLDNHIGGSSTAGRLKSTSGWNSNGNGLDTYGFSALPGGRRYSGGSFYSAGYYGYWWSASEDISGDAYIRGMNYNSDNAYWNGNDKSNGFSVRCVQDNAP